MDGYTSEQLLNNSRNNVTIAMFLPIKSVEKRNFTPVY